MECTISLCLFTLRGSPPGERNGLRENARANAAPHTRVALRVPLSFDPLIESSLVGHCLLHFRNRTVVWPFPLTKYFCTCACRFCLHYSCRVAGGQGGVDKTRNMEHSGTFRNMPEHAGTWKNKNNFHEKNNNNNNKNNKKNNFCKN